MPEKRLEANSFGDDDGVCKGNNLRQKELSSHYFHLLLLCAGGVGLG